MGGILEKPVETTVVERHGSPAFHVGIAEMNGYRSNMEDAHIIYMKEDWGFFGVFDGHGGDECSAFVAKLMRQKLDADGCPKDDAAVKKLILDVDQAFLDSEQSSGSTATMCIVHKPTSAGGRQKLRVINAGDSRVVLGRRDGTIVDGGGNVDGVLVTEQGLTRDHKPSDPEEKERIYRCGGHVSAENGVARVNGNLAVSRGFGDAEYKKTGGPDPEDRPVTADPELGHYDCDEADFLLLVCDGVSEGDFPNPEVVKFVADQLNDHGDPGVAARAVCFKAVEKNSKDNITCMIVQFQGKEVDEKNCIEFIPGPLGAPRQSNFMTAYKAFAEKHGYTPVECVELRYDNICKELAELEASTTNIFASERAQELQKELETFGTVVGDKGSEERKTFFETWLAEQSAGGGAGGEGGGGGQMSERNFLNMLMSRQGGREVLQQLMQPQEDPSDAPGAGRKVTVPSLPTLKKAVDDHPKLQWDDKMHDMVEANGVVKRDDDSDGTTQVSFPDLGLVAWLPTDVLRNVDEVEGSAA